MLPCVVFVGADEVTKHGAFHLEAGMQLQVLCKCSVRGGEARLCLLGHHCAFPDPRQVGLLSPGRDGQLAGGLLGGAQHKVR